MKVTPGEVRGSIAAPPSKSVTIRALTAAALSRGTSEILRPSRCLDAEAAASALEVFGASFDWKSDAVLVTGGGGVRATTVDCGESALCMRMLAPLAAALSKDEMKLHASGSLARRPMQMLEAPLRALGAQCSTDHGLPPLRVRGPLRGGGAVVDASSTSQVLTGLLFALSLCPVDSELEVPTMVSQQYVGLTLEVLAAFGIRVAWDRRSDTFRIPGRQTFSPCAFPVEGDWSAAAFFLVAGAIAGDVRVTGLRLDSAQADACILEVLRRCGARIDQTDGVRVSREDLTAFECDVSATPDLLPPLAVLACACRGTTVLSGVGRTRLKESDRVAALCDSLGPLGANIEVRGDIMRVAGGPLHVPNARHGLALPGHGDHRIAMAVAIAALRSSAPVDITGPECVAKSYPHFFDDLESLLS